MAVQLSLDHCGVVLVGRSQGGTSPGPQPQKGPTNVTDCGSDPLLMAGGGQSRASTTSHRALECRRGATKKLELQQFLKEQKIDICYIQETHLNNTHRFSIGDMKYTELTEQTDAKVECLHLSKSPYHPQRSKDQRKLTRNTSP